MTPLQMCLLGVVGLLGVGLYGLLVTRNLIKVVIVLQILVKAACSRWFWREKPAARQVWARAWRPR